MALPTHFYSPDHEPISCVDMHTAGMPTRIGTKGYPSLSGSLLEQRAEAKKNHDHIRERLLQEPRGHSGMYGAVLRPETELTASGEAHMGVLFLHGEGYSNMCGHATIAVCRLLVDLHDTNIFPRRNGLVYDAETKSVRVVLHTPGGLVKSDVPSIDGGTRSDPTRPVSFVAIPAFALATDLSVDIPKHCRWPELKDRLSVVVSLGYASAASCHIDLAELGFPAETFRGIIDFAALDFATKQLKAALNDSDRVKPFLRTPNENHVCVFGVMVEDQNSGSSAPGTDGAETGFYLFGEQHLDRSPTGSVVAARNAIKHFKGELGIGRSWTYHSILTQRHGKDHGFVGKTLRQVEVPCNNGSIMKGVEVQVSGHAYYTGTSTCIVENEDRIGKDGFLLHG